MFESAELGHCITDREYDRAEPKLREALLKAQYELLAHKDFPVIIVIGGVDGAGKGETVNILNEWMDPRHIVTHAFGEMSDEERERPRMWRYWRALPPQGRIGILFGAWHSQPIQDRVRGRLDDNEFELALEEIVHFERMLADEGALILKFWFHLSKKAQKKRLQALESNPQHALAGYRHRLGAVQGVRPLPQGFRNGAARNERRTRALDRDRGHRSELPLSDRRAHFARCHAEAPGRRQAPG